MNANSRTLHALAACLLFLGVALLCCAYAGYELDLLRTAFWSGAGVASYILWSRAFGFDPLRTRVAEYAPAIVRYVDRWEVRQGQATLSMLVSILIGAQILDPEHYVTALASSTFAAWTYFVLRLYAGGYRTA